MRQQGATETSASVPPVVNAGREALLKRIFDPMQPRVRWPGWKRRSRRVKMLFVSLEQASFFAQIISAVAVVASLIFVGVQLGQANKVARAASSQAHSAMYHSLITSLINDDLGFATIWRKALVDLNSLTEDERVRFFAFASAFFRFFEAARVQWLRGQLNDEHWHTIEQQAISLSVQPGIRAFWEVRRHWHCADFRQWFESLPKMEARPLYHQLPVSST